MHKMKKDEYRLLRERGLFVHRQPKVVANADGAVVWVVPLPEDANEAGLTWYVDGSLIDSFHRDMARLGVGVAAVDDFGTLVAAAYARPPAWIRTIPAAEAWALWLVLATTVRRKRVVTDCKRERHRVAEW